MRTFTRAWTVWELSDWVEVSLGICQQTLLRVHNYEYSRSYCFLWLAAVTTKIRIAIARNHEGPYCIKLYLYVEISENHKLQVPVNSVILLKASRNLFYLLFPKLSPLLRHITFIVYRIWSRLSLDLILNLKKSNNSG